jgi:hypothetical protein
LKHAKSLCLQLIVLEAKWLAKFKNLLKLEFPFQNIKFKSYETLLFDAQKSQSNGVEDYENRMILYPPIL